MRLLIALDFDGTYTADPALWHGLVRAAGRAGHRVTLVTVRAPNGGNDYPESAAKLMGIPLVRTDGKSKRSAITADVWIDAMPIPTSEAIVAMAKDETP